MNWNDFKYFTEKEFTCKCGCGCSNVSPEFLIKLEEAREIAGTPFKINSGCRCKTHNKKIGGVEHSPHLCSKHLPSFAADIHCNTDRRRFLIVQALIDAGFTHIGLSKKDRFIHVDDDSRKAVWLY